MPTVNINKKEFEKYVGKKLPDDKLKDRISYLGTDLEDVNEKEIIVEVFPNRPDMLSEQGFARAFSSFIGHKTGLRKYAVKKSGYKVIVDKVPVRPYTACAIIRNMKFTDESIREVMQMQEKLATTHGRNRKKSAYGVYPIKNVKFPIKYTMKNPNEVMFQPLGFKSRMPAIETEKIHPTAKKFKGIADSWKVQGHSQYPFFVDANGNVMSMLPYTNSEDTGRIDEATTEVFIECTGTDYQNINFALNMFAAMFADMGGDVYSLDMEYHDKKITTPDLNPQKMKVDSVYINKLLGLNLAEKDFKKYFERMGYDYKDGTAFIPSYRADILHQVDLAEDIAVAYGYENFESTIPSVSTVAEEDKFEIFKNKICDLMAGLGFLEASTYSLTNKNFQFKKMNAGMQCIELENSISSDYDILRAWVIPSLMEILSSNKHHEYPQKVFTIGTVFRKNEKFETKIEENDRIAAVISSEKSDYTEIRQVFDYLLRSLDLKCDINDAKHKSFIDGRAARASVSGKEVAYIGEIHPEVLQNWSLEMPVTAFELNLTELFGIIKNK